MTVWEPECTVEYYTIGNNPGNPRPKTRMRWTHWKVDNKPHMIGGPSTTLHNHDTGRLIQENYWQYGRQHRIDGPGLIYYFDDGTVLEEWYLEGRYYKTFEEWIKDTPLPLEKKIEMRLMR